MGVWSKVRKSVSRIKSQESRDVGVGVEGSLFQSSGTPRSEFRVHGEGSSVKEFHRVQNIGKGFIEG